tara:strand:- start:60 stop:635 length:576 start_codon:yes stop_codon:yes gene_type:complete
MNKILTYILIFLTFSCVDKKNKTETQTSLTEQSETEISDSEKTKKTIFDKVFRKINEIEYFKNYENGISSVINYEESRWEYVFVEMVNNNKRIVILEKIVETGKHEKKYQILDTIHINNFKENEFTSFGVCQNNGKADSRIFTMIERTENDFDLEYYSKIKSAWKANLKTKKIEKTTEINGIMCMNESYGI